MNTTNEKDEGILSDIMDKLRKGILTNKEADTQFSSVSKLSKGEYLASNFLDDYGKVPNMVSFAESIIEVVPLYYDRSKSWWFWNTERLAWELIDETDIVSFIHKITQWNGIVTMKNESELLRALRMVGRNNKPKEPNKNWIQFRNYIFDVKTGERLPCSREYFFTNPIPWSIGMSEDTPTIDRLFVQWVGEENKQILYEIIAYCMLADYPIHRLFCLIGKGRNGKGTFQRLIKRVIGMENITSTDFERLWKSNFESARLYKKLVCEIGETNFSMLKNTGLIKSLSGQDLLPGEFKNKPPFDFENYAKIIIATNSLPPTEDKTEGFFSRWIIVDFPNQFTDIRDILQDIPDEEYSNLCLKSINILKKLLEVGRFTNEGLIQDKMRMYEDKSNPLKKFIRLKCQISENPNDYIPLWEFESQFIVFLEENGYRIISKKFISSMVKSEGFDIERTDIYQDNERRQWKVIYGIKWLESDSVTVGTDVKVFQVDSTHREMKSNPSNIGTNEYQKDTKPQHIVGTKLTPQFSKEETLEDSVVNLLKELENSELDKSVPQEMVVQNFEKNLRPQVQKLLKIMLESGYRVFEPKPGYVKLL